MIYVCWTDVSGPELNAETKTLSDYRREKLKEMKLPAARRCALSAELMLQHALKKYAPELPLPPRIQCGEQGKPYLRDSAWKFNLSHSGVFAACALSEREVGLDIQREVSARDALLKRVLTQEERAWLDEATDLNAAFTELWCRKESFVKATGKGLAMGLQSFCAAPGAEQLSYAGNNYEIYYERLPEFHLALCFPITEVSNIIIERIELP